MYIATLSAVIQLNSAAVAIVVLIIYDATKRTDTLKTAGLFIKPSLKNGVSNS